MSTAPYKNTISSAVAETLNAAGFRKSGSVFTRPTTDVVHLVSLQSSQSSTSVTLRITANLAICIPALSESGAKPDIWESHWNERIGSLMPVRNDHWWEVSSEREAAIAANEISIAIRDFGLPALNRLSSASGLRQM